MAIEANEDTQNEEHKEDDVREETNGGTEETCETSKIVEQCTGDDGEKQNQENREEEQQKQLENEEEKEIVRNTKPDSESDSHTEKVRCFSS